MTQAAQAPLLLTGATGRSGGLLRAVWAAEPPPGLCPLWQSRAAPRGPGWVRWDPAGPAPLPAPLAGGVLLHFAGPTPASGGALEATAALALAGLEAAQEAGAAHVFLASSAAVYGRPESDAPLAETAPVAPLSAYGAAKAEMEEAAHRWRAEAGSGAPGLTILRIGNVAGADALLSAARTATAAAPLVLDRFPDGATPRRSYIGPRTFAHVLAALAGLALARDRLPEVVNVAAPGAGAGTRKAGAGTRKAGAGTRERGAGTREGVEMEALLDALAAAGVPVPYRHRVAGAAALRAVVLDTARLHALVPLAPETGSAARLIAEWRAVEGGR